MKPKGPGRPPLDDEDESVPVCVTLPLRLFDSTCQRAREDRVSLPERIRRDIREAQIKSKK